MFCFDIYATKTCSMEDKEKNEFSLKYGLQSEHINHCLRMVMFNNFLDLTYPLFFIFFNQMRMLSNILLVI